MIVKVTKSNQMRKLIKYLVGPGRHNEHTNPHIVAGDPRLVALYEDDRLNMVDATAIAKFLDEPRNTDLFNIDRSFKHVWHASLAVKPHELEAVSGNWQAIAADFVAAMGFDDPESPKAPCRWVAIDHGLSKTGNPHIHIAVDLVRTDGTRASVHKDYVTASAAVAAIEKKYGLDILESRGANRRAEGLSRAEIENTPAGTEPARRDLELAVRGAAASASDEAEFVRRLRQDGVIVSPRFAKNSTTEVTGYSVASRAYTDANARPVFFGGGKLGADLTLPRLRAQYGWPTDTAAVEAAGAEWFAAKNGGRPAAPGREASTGPVSSTGVEEQTWQEATAALDAEVTRLTAIPLDDHAGWAAAARQGAGVLAAWAGKYERNDPTGRYVSRADLAAAARALSVGARTKHLPPARRSASNRAMSDAAMLLAAGRGGAAAQIAAIRSMVRLIEAIERAERAAGRARAAEALAQQAAARLMKLHASLPPAPTAEQEASGPVITGPIPRTGESSHEHPEATPAPGASTETHAPTALVPTATTPMSGDVEADAVVDVVVPSGLAGSESVAGPVVVPAIIDETAAPGARVIAGAHLIPAVTHHVRADGTKDALTFTDTTNPDVVPVVAVPVTVPQVEAALAQARAREHAGVPAVEDLGYALGQRTFVERWMVRELATRRQTLATRFPGVPADRVEEAMAAMAAHDGTTESIARFVYARQVAPTAHEGVRGPKGKDLPQTTVSAAASMTEQQAQAAAAHAAATGVELPTPTRPRAAGADEGHDQAKTPVQGKATRTGKPATPTPAPTPVPAPVRTGTQESPARPVTVTGADRGRER